MWTQAVARVVLACEEVGEGAGGELCRGSKWLGDEALVAAKTCGRGAVRGVTTVQDL